MSARRQPARQAHRRQDLRPGSHRLLRRVPAAVVEAVAHGHRPRHPQARRRGGRADGQPAAHRPDRRPSAPGRHRSFRPAPRFHPERAPALRDRYRRTPRAAAPGREGAAGHLHRRRRRVLQQARRGPRGQSERHRRAVAERVALRTARPRRGRLSAAPDQPSPEGVRGGAQGGLRAPAAADRHVPAVSGQRRRHRVLAREPAGDLRQQYPSPQGRPDDPSRAVAHRPARRLPRAHRTSRTPTRARTRTSSSTCAATRCSDRAI